MDHMHISGTEPSSLILKNIWYTILQQNVLTNHLLDVIIFMPPFEKGGVYCFAQVGRYVCNHIYTTAIFLLLYLSLCTLDECSALFHFYGLA